MKFRNTGNQPCLFLRVLDVAVSTIGIVMTSPILLAVTFLLHLHYPYRVLFRQDRIGYGGRSFKILKLVTMVPNAEHLPGGGITFERDPRILPLGRILRKTKINELTQLVNVLRGDMGIVGPRPTTLLGFSKYPKAAQDKLVQMRPGITGIASIILYNEEELLSSVDEDRQRYHDEVIKPYKVEIEHWYLKNQSLRLYIEVVIATILTLVDGAPRLFSWWHNLPQPPTELTANPAFRVRSRKETT